MSARRAVLPRDGAIFAVVGSAGMGKTTLVARFAVREAMASYRRILAFDPTGDVYERCVGSSAAGSKERIPKEWCAQVSNAADARRAYGRAVFKEGSRAVFLSRKGRQKISSLVEDFLTLADDENARGMVLLADEAHLIFPLGTSAKSDALAVSTLVRNRRQSLLWTTQRPQNVSVSTRQNSRHVCVFRADSARYVDPGCAEWGDVELFQRAHELKRFEYLYRSPPGDELVTVRTLHGSTDPLPF